jgi:hypothetical protein
MTDTWQAPRYWEIEVSSSLDRPPNWCKESCLLGAFLF